MYKCATLGCLKQVREVIINNEVKHNYYCIEHMRCGLTHEDNPCQGCLKTYQEDSKKIEINCNDCSLPSI